MEINFKTFGQGPPVVILHGLFGNLDNWQTFAKQLAAEHTVYILDQRNHGRSFHADEMNYPIMAEDLRQFLEDQWVYRSHLIGHSMGGKTAMQFALDFPDMVDRLVVVDIAPKAYVGGHQDIFDAMLSLDLDQVSSRKEAEEQLATRIADPGVRLFLLKNLTRGEQDKYRWKVNLPALHRAYAGILAPVTGPPFPGPALFVRGERSDYIQDTDWPVIETLFPAARLETITGAGHWVHADAPEALLQVVRSFLSES